MQAAFLLREALVGDAGVGGVDAEGGEVILLLEEDLAEVLAKGELVELVGLADAAAVVADGLDFVVEVEAKHVLSFFAGFDGFGGDGGHAAEVVDLVGEDEGVGELFPGMDLKLAGDVHVLRAFEDLGVVDAGCRRQGHPPPYFLPQSVQNRWVKCLVSRKVFHRDGLEAKYSIEGS